MLDREKDRGVFRQHADPESEPDRKPPGAAAGLLELGERQQQKGGGDQHRIVRRRQNRADRHGKRQVEIERGGGADPFIVEQDRARAPDGEACRQRQQHAEHAHAKLSVAEQRGAEPDQNGIDRRMVVIAAGDVLGPDPIKALVERERREGRASQPHADKNHDRDDDRGLVPPLGQGGAAERNQIDFLRSWNGAIQAPPSTGGLHSRTAQPTPTRAPASQKRSPHAVKPGDICVRTPSRRSAMVSEKPDHIPASASTTTTESKTQPKWRPREAQALPMAAAAKTAALAAMMAMRA